MSLHDIITGARNEAQENQRVQQKAKAGQGTKENDEGSSSGFERRSIARARPTRQKAAGVHEETISHGKKSAPQKAPVQMTKEEKRAARQKERDEEDRRSLASQALLQADPTYKKNHRVSLALIIGGLICTLISWLIVLVFPESQYDLGSFWGMAAIVTLIIAYVGVIGGFVVDFAHLHKLRKYYNDKVWAMTEKQMNAIIDKRNRELAERPSFFDRFRKKKTTDEP
ncbi:hypothetical protein [Atopobium sp. oral taxon 416]|jgi:cation transport ATPase|uniref:hypothetical protein n=1 Tax=Atopobium sp. oral taxon 416 TaxID=712157 RepID=UPI001BA7E5C0|nr:hypothetical protein [Atopobium sp. oral taxon 416]QUC03451.1 hypothetical protein J4859_00275 [Atopobium sp. oral taxon 416]